MSANHNTNKSYCKLAFTIPELLIVITVLAIIAAIILALFLRTRNLSYRAQCVSNLRQLGAAFSLYTQDWYGYFPGPGGLTGDRCYWSQSDLRGGLNIYIRQQGLKSVWCCPLLAEWHGKFMPRSYSMNSYLRTPCDVEYPTCVTYPYCLKCQSGINLSKIMESGKTILLFEGIPLTNGKEDSLDYLYRCANWTRVRGFTKTIVNTIDPEHPWHGRFNNYLYSDMHIVTRPPGKKIQGQGEYSTKQEMYEWYVNKDWFRVKFADYKY